jgi:hypothetical protein
MGVKPMPPALAIFVSLRLKNDALKVTYVPFRKTGTDDAWYLPWFAFN